jgi:hypothetical protein
MGALPWVEPAAIVKMRDHLADIDVAFTLFALEEGEGS